VSYVEQLSRFIKYGRRSGTVQDSGRIIPEPRRVAIENLSVTLSTSPT
jgi:hypothetical protein